MVKLFRRLVVTSICSIASFTQVLKEDVVYRKKSEETKLQKTPITVEIKQETVFVRTEVHLMFREQYIVEIKRMQKKWYDILTHEVTERLKTYAYLSS